MHTHSRRESINAIGGDALLHLKGSLYSLGTLNANISEAVKNLVDLDLQAIFAKWMEGLYYSSSCCFGFPILIV